MSLACNRIPVLVTALATALAMSTAACSIMDPATVTPFVPTPDRLSQVTPEASAAAFTLVPLNTQLGVGFERFAFRLLDETNTPVKQAIVKPVFYEGIPGGDSLREAAGDALFFGPTLPGGGAWVLYTEFDSSGPWTIDVTIQLPDGRSAVARASVTVEGRTLLPRAGMKPPTVDTPKTDGDDFSAFTTDPNPLEHLYRLSIADAMETGRPFIVLFASAEHCENEMCRVMMSEYRALWTAYRDRVEFIHIESRNIEQPSLLSPTASAWGIPSEPWLFMFDGRGFMQYRVEGGAERTELSLLVDRLLQGS